MFHIIFCPQRVWKSIWSAAQLLRLWHKTLEVCVTWSAWKCQCYNMFFIQMHKKCLDCASPQMEPVLPDSMGNKCRGGFLLSFADTAKAQVQAAFHLYLLFTPTHSLLTSASAQRKISMLVTFLFQLQSQPPARAQVWAAVGGGKEAGAGRFVLLSPQRFSKLLHFTFYLMSHLNAFKVVALFASDGSNLIGKAQVERIQDEFCLLLYRWFLFRSFTSCFFSPQEPRIVCKLISNSQVLGGSRWASQSC